MCTEDGAADAAECGLRSPTRQPARKLAHVVLLLGFATPVVLALVATTPSAPAEEAEGALCRIA